MFFLKKRILHEVKSILYTLPLVSSTARAETRKSEAHKSASKIIWLLLIFIFYFTIQQRKTFVSTMKFTQLWPQFIPKNSH